jgi:hypothetical protein
MAVTPNTTFTSGQILTAAQMNAFPRGLMTAIVTEINTYVLTTSNATQLTAASFTAVAGRNYRITYYEPRVRGTTAAGSNTQTMFIFNGATQLQETNTAAVSTDNLLTSGTCIYVGTLTAGATVITAQAVTSSTTGTAAFQRTATRFAFLTIEDIGAA